MEVKKIAGVSVIVSKIHTIKYETIFKMALNSPKYYLKKDAEKLIEKELNDNGIFKQNKPTSKVSQHSGDGGQSDNEPKGKNSRSGKKSVEKRGKT